MTALVSKASISGTPTRATANAGFGDLWEFVDERFSTGDATQAEKVATHVALETTRTNSPLDAAVASNALTITIKPRASEFRSATLTSGAVTILANAADLTLVVPNGATLGTSNGVLARLAVLELNNAGTKEAAVVNLLGGVDISGTGVISTTTISTGADSAGVVYSTTGRSNVPYRLVEFIEITEATAGVWATDPSLVGGNAIPLAKWFSGYGQTLQTVTRTSGTPYTNTTGRPIELSVSINGASAACSTAIVIDGSPSIAVANAASGTGPSSAAGSIKIPAGATYTLTDTGVSARGSLELR